MLSQQDLKQIAQKGITQEQIENQLNEFKTGFPFLKLEAAAGPLASDVASSPQTPLHVSSMRISGTPIRPRASVW